MSSIAILDKQINVLQDQIDAHKQFLGGGAKLSNEETAKLRALESYLKELGRGGKKDLDIVHSLLLH